MQMFQYDTKDNKTELYELLDQLMARWEHELVEFKEAKGNYSEDKIGPYFSAISNEANLMGQQYGWLVLGISEQQEKHPVGTSFKAGDPMLLEKFKYEFCKNTTDGITFLEILELHPVYQGKVHRVLMFKIPAAAVGIPTAWKNRYYARSGDSLVPLQQYKIDTIRNQERKDWSRQILPGAGFAHLDKTAIACAREKYKEKMGRLHIAEEIDAMTDQQFLTKIKLMRDGKITNAAMVLLGSGDNDTLFPYTPTIIWRLFGSDNQIKDYEIFTIPFIHVPDRIFAKIRNLTYRYMPNQLSLFPKETQQYDNWLLRELIHNCIAHSNYQQGGRVSINEFEDRIVITNPGNFLPGSIKPVLQPTYNPPFYRNQLLADTMVYFNMIDTATSGIKKVYRIQREKLFPLPDYDFSDPCQVMVTVYGKTLDERYTHILFEHPDLDLETVFALDQVQKGYGAKLNRDVVAYLRRRKLVEGRVGGLYLSAEVAKSMNEESRYIKNRAFDDQYYKDMIIQYLRQYEKAQKQKIRDLLWDKLPDALSEKQKMNKISTLLTALRKKGMITTDSPNPQTSYWVLTKKGKE